MKRIIEVPDDHLVITATPEDLGKLSEVLLARPWVEMWSARILVAIEAAQEEVDHVAV